MRNGYKFDREDKVKIKGVDHVFTVSKYWEYDDEVILDSPTTSWLITVDYRALEVIVDPV